MKLLDKINEILTVRDENGVAYNYIEDWVFEIHDEPYADKLNAQERKDIEHLIGVLRQIQQEIPIGKANEGDC